jgi:hypothetical protein
MFIPKNAYRKPPMTMENLSESHWMKPTNDREIARLSYYFHRHIEEAIQTKITDNFFRPSIEISSFVCKPSQAF